MSTAIRRWLGLDLAGRLSAFKRRYQGNVREFDHRNVECTVSAKGNGTFLVSAWSYCVDPLSEASRSGNRLRFYTSPQSFLSRVEAEAHLEAEVRNASQRHPQTKFFRERTVRLVENGRVSEDVIDYTECCLAGTWRPTHSGPSYRRCSGCGLQTEESICPRCGEPVFS